MDILKDVFGIQVKYESWEKQESLPLYLRGGWDFQKANMNGCACIVLTPKDELPDLPALKKQISKIRETDGTPIVLKLKTISPYRRKSLVENGIPFFTEKQVFLPFMGTLLTAEGGAALNLKKLTPSAQQLLLLFAYTKKRRLYASKAAKELGLTAMTMSRAAKQLEATGLFTVAREGVNKVIETEYEGRELFEKSRRYLATPVRGEAYAEKKDLPKDAVFAGESALTETTMLSAGGIETYAVSAKEADKSRLAAELIDSQRQVRVELWKYDPKRFAKGPCADKLSVALSLADSTDERIEGAVEELLESVWG